MTDDIRDARKEPGASPSPQSRREGAPAPAGDAAAPTPPAEPGSGGEEPLVSAESAEAEVGAAEAFAAGTMAADRLGAAVPANAPAGAPPDYKDRWLRAEAELQNSRRRAQREREDAVRASEDRILLDMVEVLDDLERALAAIESGAAPVAWAQGVALTAQRLRDALARRGVTPTPALGEPFDPAFHEALLEIAAPEGIRPGAVAQEVLKGYRRGERALRAARVVVARADR
jgi:molecular chaperone GrpE